MKYLYLLKGDERLEKLLQIKRIEHKISPINYTDFHIKAKLSPSQSETHYNTFFFSKSGKRSLADSDFD